MVDCVLNSLQDKIFMFDSLSRRQKTIIFSLGLIIVIGFIFDNTLAPLVIEGLKQVLNIDEVHIYTTSISIQIFSVALGIYLGFFADRWKAGSDLMKELVKILPLVEFEIRVNYRILEKNVNHRCRL